MGGAVGVEAPLGGSLAACLVRARVGAAASGIAGKGSYAVVVTGLGAVLFPTMQTLVGAHCLGPLSPMSAGGSGPPKS